MRQEKIALCNHLKNRANNKSPFDDKYEYEIYLHSKFINQIELIDSNAN